MLFIQFIPHILFIMLLSWNVLTIASASFDTFTTDSSPYGIPYNEWLEKWVTWWTKIPIDKHPYIVPSDPERCSIMQEGPVWFLPDITPRPGKTLDYNCNIPLSKSILIPVSITFCEKDTKGTCGHSLTDKELLELADNIRTPIEQLEVEIDGIKIPLNGPPIKTGFFNISVPDPPPREIWAELKTGTHKTTASAYFLIVHDMPAGKHVIKLKVLDLLKGNEGPPPRFEPLRSGSYEILIQ
jgi:hypothetical protein